MAYGLPSLQSYRLPYGAAHTAILDSLAKQISDGHSDRNRVDQVGQRFRQLVPNAGSYLNESNYFHPDMAHAAWGENYPRLQAVKKQVDPTDLFHVHHGVRPRAG